jgi:hypothetical protein
MDWHFMLCVMQNNCNKNFLPPNDVRFIALVERGLEIQQADHVPRADAGPTDITSVTRIEPRQIDYARQDLERMFVIKNFSEFPAEQFPLRMRIIRFYILSENEAIRELCWQIIPKLIAEKTTDFASEWS